MHLLYNFLKFKSLIISCVSDFQFFFTINVYFFFFAVLTGRGLKYKSTNFDHL